MTPPITPEEKLALLMDLRGSLAWKLDRQVKERRLAPEVEMRKLAVMDQIIMEVRHGI